MLNETNLIATNQIIRVLSRDYDVDITWRKLHSMILNAEIPAELINGRYYALDSNLPEIARIIGAKPKSNSRNVA